MALVLEAVPDEVGAPLGSFPQIIHDTAQNNTAKPCQDEIVTDHDQEALDRVSAMKKGQFEQNVISNLAVVSESSDKRVRRIENARTFTRGVAAYRERTPVTEPTPADSGLSCVYVRARPLFKHEAERGEWDCVSGCESGLVVHEGTEKVRASLGSVVKVLRHHSFPEVKRIDSDEGVYLHLQYLVQRALAGSMATLFMYGMTGSGKTYSTNLIHQKAPQELIASGPVQLISYELIGKRCFDLLGTEKQEVHLRIGEDGATHVQGSTVQEARTTAELQALLHEAGARRETSATGTNAESSRSHAVYQLRTLNGGTLTIIDLAGNEGNIETQYHTTEQMKQAAEINSSLMALRACLAARASGKSHIPFRESILTRVLKDAFTMQDAATAVLCCVSPACSHLERTLNTLRSAVNLTGQPMPTRPVDEELQEKGIVKGGPATWDATALATWIQQQEFEALVTVPEEMNGQQIMRQTAVRLAPMCGDDRAVAQQLFNALRKASKEAAQKDRELRQAMKGGPKPTSSVGFSKAAPSRPIVSVKLGECHSRE